ncbi:response regulator [Holophaga foetida]|uniref:response regulator n=1 Tax=Holophaga foetida TaxID=35839 RepID=UPI0002473F1F|nr:response regulator [Holophaga foetida]
MLQDPILLVDDDAELLSTLHQTLSMDGYQVDAVGSADAALEAVKQRHYPVVLTDLNMPGGPDGLELISAVKARDPKVLCILFTGYASLDTAIQAVKRGAYDFIRKPFKVAELEAVLDRALDHAMLLRQLEGYQKDLEARVLTRWQEQQAFHQEVLELNAILLETLDCSDERAILAPFLRFLKTHFRPDTLAVLRPEGDRSWTTLEGPFPEREWIRLPAPGDLIKIREWDDPESYLIPLRRGDCLMAALSLGFEKRSSFHPEQPSFELWRKHLEAALFALHRVRAQTIG